MKIPFPSGSNPIKRSLRRPPETPWVWARVPSEGPGFIWFLLINIIIKSTCLSYLPPNWCQGKILSLGSQGGLKTSWCIENSQCRVLSTKEEATQLLGIRVGAGGRTLSPGRSRPGLC